MHYVWQGVIVAISRRIRDVKIAANSRYVCQVTYLQTIYRETECTGDVVVLRWQVLKFDMYT